MLKLLVISASNLIDVDFGPSNKSDPYVKAIFRGEERKTKHIEDDLNPVWTEEHNNVLGWEVSGQPLSSSDEIEVKVKDWEKFLPKKVLGQVTISLGELLKTKDYTLERSYPLLDTHNRATISNIVLRLHYKPSKVELETQQYELQYMNEESEEDGMEDDEEQGGTRTRKSRRRRTLRQERREWSTKVQHFKIRVTIHEGRHLPGTNISPITRVTVKHQKQQTRVKNSTNSPVFNQTFTFNFHTSEADLFDNLLVLEVFDSKNFIVSKRLLGYFESDIGAIYEFPEHAFVRKWILLTGTGAQLEDETETKQSRIRGRDGETAGYLKVTAIVLGPGDESPQVPQQHNEEEEDIESNCLMSAGIVRQPAKFLLKVFQAEDLPRMDTGFGRSFLRWFLPGGGKESADEKAKLVDPYMVFSFCGKRVHTTTKYRQNNPTYNEMLTLPLMFPSMCERIKLRFFDWDRGRTPDIISTAFLPLSEISGQDNGSGFLPQFGPCFVNFYGSPREFSLISNDYKDLDKGIGEGVAYRGRVLIELTTEQASPTCQPSNNNLYDEDKIKIQPFLKQDHFKLFACFKDAAMISRTDGAIEFEVSIGNFGNTLDETAVSCNTPPTNPVYDGSHYHYLPWRHYKPCICLDCRWEDIAFRIEPLNIINRLCEKLGIVIQQVKEKDILAGVPQLKTFLQEIIQRCSHTEFLDVPGVRNGLDYKLNKLRKDEFKYIVEDAKGEEAKLDSLEEVEIDLNEIMETVEGFLHRLKNVAKEPQISMPDVIIWMLCGGKRVAYHRVPIQDVLYSTNKEACGKYCGKTVELLMKHPGKEAGGNKEHQQVPAMVRVELWVGLREHQHVWSNREENEGKFKVYAETYENESRGLLGWSSPGIGLRSHYSNASGDLELHKDKFVAPKGWQFNGDWKPILERSVLYDRDYGLRIFTDEIYEHQSRNLLGGGWNTKSHWTEADGEPSDSPDQFPRPEGWRWISKEWTVDLDRAVDEEGWEYSESETFGGIYLKAEKPLHMTRRRRWVCTRELVDPRAERKQEKLKKLTEEGWEYSLSFASRFHAKPRARDLVRRKRLLREIVHEKDTTLKNVELPPRLAINLEIKISTLKKAKKKEETSKEPEEEEELLDEEDREGHLPVIPRMFIVHDKPHKFQLWVYIYQARDLLALDDSGMSDPYVRVVFGNQSQMTEWKPQTISPTWDQTLIFSHVEIFDKLENVVGNPPNVIMEVFDRDPGMHDFIGRCMMKPLVQTAYGATPASLQWFALQNGMKDAGEVLAAAELFLDEGEKLPTAPTPKKTHLKKFQSVFPVRDLVRPALQTVAVEILCWGVRNMDKYKYSYVNAPSVEFEWGDQVFKTEIENLKKYPNFSKPKLARKFVCLPVEPYTPAMNIRVYDNRMFNSKPLVGVHSLSSLKKFISDEPPMLARGMTLDEPDTPLTPSPFKPVRRKEVHKKGEENFDWWSKYYCSMRKGTPERREIETQEELTGKLLDMFSFSSDDEVDSGDHLDHYERAGYDKLKIFPKELEKMEEFGGLEDFVTTFNLKRGKSKGDDEDYDDNIGQLKASFWIYPVKEDQSKTELPPSKYANLSETRWKWPIKCLVRVYVICAFDLQPQDPNGLADPYVVVSLGNKTYDEKNNCQHNTLKPVFGKMFEFRPSIPTAKDLKVKVMDYDRGTFDETIGETVIDLEQRLLSRLHASCGLPTTYSVSGPFPWRDSKRPKDILKGYCRAKGYEHPSFYPKGKSPNTLVVETNKTSLSLSVSDIEGYDGEASDIECPDQQLALLALHRLGLVPEHVETRSLYSSLQPQIEQGKLQMWVDVFPLIHDADIKPAVKIEPREPLSYVLRVIIWDTTDVKLQETSITGERMSDIYVKGWIDGMEEKQKTDVHYRSLDGDGNFNWRMVFPFRFLPMEKKISISKKTKFTHLYKTEEKVEPKLKIQIWEDDKFSPDDFLGTRTLKLHNLARPCKSPKYCGTKNDPSIRKKRPDDFVNLFQCKGIRGWWGCWEDDSLEGELQGKVDMTIELLTEEEAQAKPVGKGRSEPNEHPNLPEPNRPKTSFLWFTSPFKTMRYILWRNYKWYIIGLVLFVLLVLIIFLFVYSMPGYTVKKIFDA